MDRYFQCAVVLCASLLLGACGTMRSSVLIEPAAGASGAAARTPIPGGMYTVRTGDTLYSIAFRNGVDFRDLAQWNRIAVPYTIWPGQSLRLSPPPKELAATSTSSTPSTPAPPAHAAAAPGTGLFEPVTAPGPATSAATAAPNQAASPPPRPQAPPPPSPTPAAGAGSVPVAGVAPAPPSTADARVAAAPVPKAPVHAAGGLAWRWPADGSVVKRFQSGEAIPGIEISGHPGDPVRAAADGVVVYSGNGLVGYGELVIIKHSDSLLSAYAHNRKRLVQEGQRVTAGQQIAEMGSTGASRTGLGFQIRKDGNPVDPLDYLPTR